MSNTVKQIYNRELDEILKGVSRSFYLTLWALPKPVRPQISTAYLIARIADTIADTEAIKIEERIQTLIAFRENVGGINTPNTDTLLSKFLTVEQLNCSPSEVKLLHNTNKIIEVMRSFEKFDIDLICSTISKITKGQELDLIRFSNARNGKIIALNTDDELDEYTYLVAGCVGEFWTKICINHLFTFQQIDDQSIINNGINYGKGLQLINILRDLARDLRNGRCYLPVEKLKTVNLNPEDLLNPANESKVRPIYNNYIAKARGHLTSGAEYIKTIPRRYAKLRIATALPLLIGIKTLNKLSNGRILNPEIKIKISRSAVWKTVAMSIFVYPCEHLFSRMLDSGKTNLE